MNKGRGVSYKYCRIKTDDYMDIDKMTGRLVKYCKNEPKRSGVVGAYNLHERVS
jgi:hypothetical protein